VETRLRLAGAERAIFTEDTYPFFWKYSDEGVPRLINKIAKLSLKAGETYGLEQVHGQVIYQVAQQFEKITPLLTARGKARKKTEGQVQGEALPPITNFGFLNPSPNVEAHQPEEIEVKQQETEETPDPVETVSSPPVAEAEALPLALVSNESPPLELVENQELLPLVTESADSLLSSESLSTPEPAEKEMEPPHPSDGLLEDIRIGEFHLQISIPSEFIEQFLGSDQETRVKMAGLAAAQTLKSHNELSTSPAADPFSIWTELRSVILQRLEIFQSGMAA
jgi:hypothetical protein